MCSPVQGFSEQAFVVFLSIFGEKAVFFSIAGSFNSDSIFLGCLTDDPVLSISVVM